MCILIYIGICRCFHLGDWWFSIAVLDDLAIQPTFFFSPGSQQVPAPHRYFLAEWSCGPKGWRGVSVWQGRLPPQPQELDILSEIPTMFINGGKISIAQFCSPSRHISSYFPLYNMDHWDKMWHIMGIFINGKVGIQKFLALFQRPPRQEVLDFLGLLDQQPVAWELQEDDKKALLSDRWEDRSVKDGMFWPLRVGIYPMFQ